MKDKNGVALGTLLGLSMSGYSAFNIYGPGGYIYSMNADGTFAEAYIYWTGTNCTGDPYFEDGTGGGTKAWAKTVSYSQAKNKLYIFANADANGIAKDATTTISFGSQESPGQSPLCSNSAGTYTGWPLVEVSASTIGASTATGTPLAVPAPLIMP